MSTLKDKVKDALREGYSPQEIRDHLKGRYDKAIKGGYSVQEVDEFLGLAQTPAPSQEEAYQPPTIGAAAKSDLDRFIRGMGFGVTKALGGIPQLFGYNQPLPDPGDISGVGQIGKLAGQLAPTFATPAATLPRMIAMGAGTGLAQRREGESAPPPEVPGLTAAMGPDLPGVTPEAVKSAALGGAASGIVGGLTRGTSTLLGKLMNKIRNAEPLNEAERKLAQVAAEKYGIPLTPGMQTRSEFAKRMESQFHKVPGSGKLARKRSEAAQRGYTVAIAKEMGETKASSLDDTVRREARARIGGEFDRLIPQAHVEAGSPGEAALTKGLDAALQEYEALITPLQSGNIKGIIQGIKTQAASPEGLSGETIAATRSKLTKIGSRAKGVNSEYGRAALQIRDALDEAAKLSSPSEVAKGLETAQRQWAILKTIEPLARKSPEGLLSGPQVHSALTRRFDDLQKAGNMGELANIGRSFLQIPSTSGTAENMLTHSLITGYGVGQILEPATAASLLLLPKIGAHAWYQTPAWERIRRSGRGLEALGVRGAATATPEIARE